MDPIILSAIKKAKKELEEKHQVSAQTLDDLKSALTDLKDTKLPRWVQDILDKVDQSTDSTGTTLSQLKSSLESKLSPWTDTRAAKLDNLDAKVSSRADGSYYTPARGTKLDNLDATVSSRADGKDWTAERAGKVDKLDVEVSTRASGDVLDVVNQNIGDVTSRDFSTVMGRLGAVLGYGEEVTYGTPGSYTFTVPDGVRKITVFMASAGGAGGSMPPMPDSCFQRTDLRASRYDKYFALSIGLPRGGGAGCSAKLEMDVEAGQKIKVVVGAGGRPLSYSGGNGGSTSFGDVVLTGGEGGAGGYISASNPSNVPRYSSKMKGAICGKVASPQDCIKQVLEGVSGPGSEYKALWAHVRSGDAKNTSAFLAVDGPKELNVKDFFSGDLNGSGSKTVTHTFFTNSDAIRAKGGSLAALTSSLKNRGNGGAGGLPQELGTTLSFSWIDYDYIKEIDEYGRRGSVTFTKSTTTDPKWQRGQDGQDGIVVITY